jgi:uncharacterized repeat protein (TIGR01451 family)
MTLGSHLARMMTLFLVLLVPLAASPAPPPVQAQPAPDIKVAYVYNNDTAARDSFKNELELRGFAVTPITLTEAGADIDPNFSQYAIIIIGHDTSGFPTAGWLGNGLARDRIVRADKYTIGIGFGGALYFDTLKLDIGFSSGVTGLSAGVQAVNPGDSLWSSPHVLPLAADGALRLYGGEVGGRFAQPDDLNGVTLIGQVQIDQQTLAYPIAAENITGQTGGTCFLLWGHRGSPTFMTPAGRNLFENLLRKEACDEQNRVRADVSVSKTGPETVNLGDTATYLLTVQAGRVAAPGVQLTDELPSAAQLVSVTPSQGNCRSGPRRVVCALGDLGSGLSATVTLVLKPTEVGTLRNLATVRGRFEDVNLANNRAAASTEVNFSQQFPPLRAIAYKKFVGQLVPLFSGDLGIHGIEMTQGIQCFDTSKGLAGCADNSLPLVARKQTTARIYLRYTGVLGSANNVPVRLVLIDTNNVEYVVNTQGKALSAIDQSAASNSANVYFSVNFNNVVPVRYYAIVDPENTITETNENNNRFPASGTNSLNFTPSKTMKIVSQRLRYHPSGYSGTQYAGGWAVNGGAATWFNQLLPIRTNGITHQVASGYLDWTTSLGNGAGQHALITNLNTRWIFQNVFAWLFGSGAYTGARHVYGWAPNDGYSGGHADMPVYPHAGGLGVVGIGTDRPGTSSDNPGGGALIFGHELVHDYDVKHTDTADSCGSDDDSSAWPYAGSSIQEFGFNPITGKVYNPASTHDIMSYCPAGGSKEGWIAPYTWSYMFNKLNASAVSELAQTADTVLGVSVSVSNPALGPEVGSFLAAAKVPATTPLVTPTPGDYALELRDAGGTVLATTSFTLTFKSEYSHHNGDHPGDPEDTASASAHMVVPWVDGTTELVLLHNGAAIGARAISAAAPSVVISTPAIAENWPAGSTQTITWEANDPDSSSLTYSVFYSRDGEEWDLLAEGLTSTSYSIAVDDLAGSTEARFRIVANDGVNIGDAETPFIVVPNKLPSAAILNPTSGASLPIDDLLVLQGFGSDFEDGMLPDVAMAWSSDRAGPLGFGMTLPVENLAAGLHVITLTVTDSNGQSSSATAPVFVGSRVYLPMTIR